MVVRAVKYNIGIRALLRDFDIGIAPTQPTNIYTDAEAVVSGRGGERMAKSSRWMAVRYAMLRWAETCLTARLSKTTSVGNCADIMTKCVTGALFFKHRATVLGLRWEPMDIASAAVVEPEGDTKKAVRAQGTNK